MAKTIYVLNGPNLNLLGVREPHIYGTTTLDTIRRSCEEFARFAGARLAFHQSNHEGVLVDLIQSARAGTDALIINPAGYDFWPSEEEYLEFAEEWFSDHRARTCSLT